MDNCTTLECMLGSIRRTHNTFTPLERANKNKIVSGFLKMVKLARTPQTSEHTEQFFRRMCEPCNTMEELIAVFEVTHKLNHPIGSITSAIIKSQLKAALDASN